MFVNFADISLRILSKWVPQLFDDYVDLAAAQRVDDSANVKSESRRQRLELLDKAATSLEVAIKLENSNNLSDDVRRPQKWLIDSAQLYHIPFPRSWRLKQNGCPFEPEQEISAAKKHLEKTSKVEAATGSKSDKAGGRSGKLGSGKSGTAAQKKKAT